MRDVMLQNPAVVTGGTLTAGHLSDGNQALSLSSSGVFDVPDSASSSLAVASGVAGGLALVGSFKVSALPGSTQTIMGKVGSYELKLTPAGKLNWILTNGASTVTVVSAATIEINRWYLFTGVYNGDYTGVTIAGSTVAGTLGTVPIYGDETFDGSATGQNNLHVTSVTMPERGTLTQINASLRRNVDSASHEWMAPVAYDSSGGEPVNLLGQGTPQYLNPDAYRQATWVTFQISANAYAGTIWLGLVGGRVNSDAPTTISVMSTPAGGQHRSQSCNVSDSNGDLTGTAQDPYGVVVGSDTSLLSLYANYTATGRTGDEGKALLYIDGVLDSSASYSGGIADSANNLQHPSGLAVTLDDWMIFNRKLSATEIAILNATL